MALGLLALGAGSFTEAAAALEPVAWLAERRGIGEPGVLPFEPDLIEAYARLGDGAAASRHLERFAGRAHAVERAWALAAAARCAGLLAGERDVQRRFAEALELGAAVASPFERARTELCYGERLRRAGQRRAARAPLSTALEGFAEAGAARWAERARAELRATGQTLGRPEAAAPAQLTPQQLQVASLVAEGHSNRRVAEALFLSRKTVEYHLAHVYRKLDVHSRVELACLFAAGAAPPATSGAVHLPSAAAP